MRGLSVREETVPILITETVKVSVSICKGKFVSQTAYLTTAVPLEICGVQWIRRNPESLGETGIIMPLSTRETLHVALSQIEISQKVGTDCDTSFHLNCTELTVLFICLIESVCKSSNADTTLTLFPGERE